MAFYLVTVDLKRAREYKSLADQLQTWGAVAVQRNVYVVEHPGSALNLRKALQLTIDPDADTVFAVQIKPGSEWTGHLVSQGAANWMAKHFPAVF